MNRYGSFPLLSAPHSLFSIWTNLKRSEKIPGAPTRRWVEWIWLTGPSGLHRNSPQRLNISSIRVFVQIRDPEIQISLRPHVLVNDFFCNLNNCYVLCLNTNTTSFIISRNIVNLIIKWKRRVIGISGSLVWSKILMELIFNPCGEFRWSPEDPVSQIQSHHFYAGAPGIFSDFLRSSQMLKREWCAESNRKLPHLFFPSKTPILVPEFVVEDLSSAELQPGFLRLQWRTCLWAEHWWYI